MNLEEYNHKTPEKEHMEYLSEYAPMGRFRFATQDRIELIRVMEGPITEMTNQFGERFKFVNGKKVKIN